MAGYLLPAGHQMTLVANSSQSGSYSLIGEQPSGYTAVSAGATVKVGPFAVPKQYNIDNLSISSEPVLFYTDETLYQPSAETNISEIGDSATGAEIATAVNSILGILVANGLMAAP